MPPTPRPQPLLGRTATVSAITSAIADSPTLAVLVHGASGVGKTRVAQDAAARLSGAGWTVITLTGTAGLSGSPLAALAPIFAGDQPDLDAITANPFALLDYATTRISALGGPHTLLLIDDLTLVDSLSLSVTVQLLLSGSAKMLATVREGDPLPDSIVSMWTGEVAQRVDIHPLSDDDSAAFIRSQLDGDVAHRTVVALSSAAGGNPLFLRELIMGARGQGDLVQRDGTWQLIRQPTSSAALRDLILSRLGNLHDSARDTVDRIALCEPVPVDELLEPGARQSLTTLEKSGIVTIDEVNGVLVASLSHPQYVAVLRASMPRMRAADLLLEQAEIVTQRAGTTPSAADAVRIATWRLGAGVPTNPELLATGARLTKLAGDIPETARLAHAAIRAGADDASIYLLLGEAMRTLGRTTEALAALNAAAVRAGDGTELAAGIATLHALTRADEPMGFSNGLTELDAAQERFPEHAIALALTRSTLLLYAERADLAVDQLAQLPTGPGVPEQLRVASAVASALPLAAIGRSTEAIAAARIALDHAESTVDGTAIISRRTGLFIMASVTLQAGDHLAARGFALDALRDAIAHDDEVSTRHAEFTLGHCYLEAGQLRTSARWFRDAVSGAMAHGPVSFRAPALGAFALLMAWRGELGEARTALESIPPEQAAWDASSVVAAAWLDAADGNRIGARDRLLVSAARYREGSYVFLESWLLFLVARLGFEKEVDARLRELARDCDSPLVAMRANHVTAMAKKSPDAAAEAGAEWELHGSLLFAAEAYALAADFATAERDSRRAAGFARQAAALFDRCEGAESALPGSGGAASGLTTREREIALMASRGLSSQAIATQLFLSIRTVDNHLQSAYRKLGVSGRTDLAGALTGSSS